MKRSLAMPVGLGLLVVAVSTINAAWLHYDDSPMAHQIDPYGYLERLLRFMDRSEPGWVPGWKAIGSLSVGGRPVLYQLLTIPFVRLLGRSVDAALTVNILLEAVLLIVCYQIGKRIHSRGAGLLAALLVASYPPIVHLSRIYRPHFATPACVASSFLLLLHVIESRRTSAAWAFGVSIAIGLLVHPYFAMVMGPPAVAGGTYLLLFQNRPRYPRSPKETIGWLAEKFRDPFVLQGLLPAALCSAALVAAWYLTWGLPLLSRGSRLAAEAHLAPGFPVTRSFWWYALTAPAAISSLFAGLALLGTLGGLLRGKPPMKTLALCVVSGYVFLSLHWAYTWWIFASLLPLMASVTAVWLTRLRPIWLSTPLIAVTAAVAVFNLHVTTWDTAGWSRSVARALGAPLESRTCRKPWNVAYCPNPPRVERWPLHNVLSTVLRDRECPPGAPCHMLVPQSLWMRLRYVLARDWPEATLTVTRIHTKRPSSGDGRGFLELAKADFILDAPPRQRVLPLLPAAFHEAHRTIATFQFPSRKLARLVKRTEPLGNVEARALAAALDKTLRVSLSKDLYEACVNEGHDKQRLARMRRAAARPGVRENGRAYAAFTLIAQRHMINRSSERTRVASCRHFLATVLGPQHVPTEQELLPGQRLQDARNGRWPRVAREHGTAAGRPRRPLATLPTRRLRAAPGKTRQM